MNLRREHLCFICFAISFAACAPLTDNKCTQETCYIEILENGTEVLHENEDMPTNRFFVEGVIMPRFKRVDQSDQDPGEEEDLFQGRNAEEPGI
jgi:hypothetical protein